MPMTNVWSIRGFAGAADDNLTDHIVVLYRILNRAANISSIVVLPCSFYIVQGTLRTPLPLWDLELQARSCPKSWLQERHRKRAQAS